MIINSCESIDFSKLKGNCGDKAPVTHNVEAAEAAHTLTKTKQALIEVKQSNLRLTAENKILTIKNEDMKRKLDDVHECLYEPEIDIDEYEVVY